MKLKEMFADGFVYLDGGFGTMLQKSGTEPGRWPELLNFSHPEIVTGIHRQYIEAGSNVIYTCTFSCNSYKLEGSGYQPAEVIRRAIHNARTAAKGTEVLIAQDIGPIGRMMEPNGDMTFEEAYEMFREQIIAGEEGTDLIVIETMTDLYEMRTALLAAKENSERPVLCTMTFEATGRTFTGTCIPSMALTLEGLGADAIGINCSLGPAEFPPLIEELSRWTTLPIIVKPNAGLPDPATGEYDITAEEFGEIMTSMIPYGARFIGGCCGTDPSFIRSLHENFRDKVYQKQSPEIPFAVCTPETVVVVDQPRIIGERINPTGKKKLKAAIAEGNLEYVLDMAVKEVAEGAEILDVNAGVPGIDEKTVIVDIIKKLQGTVVQPLQIDSGSPEVMEAALRTYCGRAIVNSVNGEEKSLSGILPPVKKYGANVIGLTLDGDGIPKTVEKRIEIAEKIVQRATDLGIPKNRLIIDCLTLTVSAEQENASNTLEAIRRVKSEMGLKTTLGVSNISFGLPGRPIINQNFLQMALTCGLDLPIINPAAPGMVAAVDVYKLIMGIDKDAKDFVPKYQDVVLETPTASVSSTKIENPKLTGLEYYIRSGLETQCREAVREALKTRAPLDIVNQDLIPILDRTGQEFEKGTIFIPQLVMSAGTAQVAFEEIKQKMQETSSGGISKGKIVLATVKGDIHDIGKNIVRVILDNYGYEIIDLGKDVDPQNIMNAVTREDVKLVGLSALMTTTLKSMEETIGILHQYAPDCRIMTGGAVLTDEYARSIGSDFYVRDAMASAAAAKDVLG